MPIRTILHRSLARCSSAIPRRFACSSLRLPTAAVDFVLSALGKSPGASVEIKKTVTKPLPDVPEDMRSEYVFDYSKAKRNPYAERLRGRTVAIVLEPDVAAAFPNSKAVNKQLRAVVRAVPRRSRTRIAPQKPGRRALIRPPLVK